MKGINNVNTVEYIILKIFSHTHSLIFYLKSTQQIIKTLLAVKYIGGFQGLLLKVALL
jgi:hypothetical protein